MQELLMQAIGEEIKAELFRQAPPADRPQEVQQRFCRLYCVYPNVKYRCTLDLGKDTTLIFRIFRDSDHLIAERQHSLGDRNVFIVMGRTLQRGLQLDRKLFSILGRVGQRLLATVRRELVVPHGWQIEFPEPEFTRDTVEVKVICQPFLTKIAWPDRRYVWKIAADRRGKCRLAFGIDHLGAGYFPWLSKSRHTKESEPDFLHIETIQVWSEEQSYAVEQLSGLIGLSAESVEDQLQSLLLPVDSQQVSPQARQAMLVLVPQRLADAAKRQGEVRWCHQLVDACLTGLAHRPVIPQTIVRQLFLQLLRLELAEHGERSQTLDEYQRLGLVLAGSRREDPSLPYNPVLPLLRQYQGRSNLDDKISPEDRARFAWFLEQATLEQIVEMMSLS